MDSGMFEVGGEDKIRMEDIEEEKLLAAYQ